MSVQPATDLYPQVDDRYRCDVLTVIAQHAAVRLNTLCVLDPVSPWRGVRQTTQAVTADETWLSCLTDSPPVRAVRKPEVAGSNAKVSDKAPPISDATVLVPPSPTTVQWESRASRPDYSTDQWRALRGAFDQSAYCSRLDRQRLVHSLHLSPADVQRWFKNARRRERRQAARLQQYFNSEQNARYSETDDAL